MGFGVQGLGFGVQGLGFGVGFRVAGAWGIGIMFWRFVRLGFRYRALRMTHLSSAGLGFRV